MQHHLDEIKILVLLIMAINLIACHSIAGDNMTEKSFSYDEIQFEGDQKLKTEAIELLDIVLKKQGDLGVYGDLSGGLDEIKKDMNVSIKEEDNYYAIDIYPKSNSGGHDFSFTIDKKTETRSDVVVGEVLPPPDFDKF